VTAVVCDASVAVAWYIEEPDSPRAEALQRAAVPLLAPELLLIETASAMLRRQRRGLPTPPGYPEVALRELRLGVGFTRDALLLEAAITLSKRLAHSLYDCFYLALARREEAALATFDRRLAELAASVAVPVWTPEAA